MRTALFLLLALSLAAPVAAQGVETTPETTPEATAEDTVEDTVEQVAELVPLDARDVNLEDFLWIARPIVIFADTPADPRFAEQIELLLSRPEPLLERDVVIIFDTDPAAHTAVREALRPRGFSLVLLDKDGTVALRKPRPWDVREITRAIDNMPLRLEEMGLHQ